ncbi:MAG: hypothetical protein HDR23_08085 [Lachnospiraceae bacterium]|nr:hypothetical protein [Lachnospiraceae bacterium]
MKVNNTAIFMGDTSLDERHGTVRNGQGQGNTIFAGNLSKNFDPVAEKRKQAQKQAMKIVTDTWAGDRKIDDDIEGRRQRISQLQEEIGKAKKEAMDIEKMREELRESCGIDPDSQEEQDLKLLEKEKEARMPGSNVHISDEEAERIKEIKAAGLTEYQERSLEMKDYAIDWEKQAYEMKKEAETERAVITATKLERLKKDPMVGAQRQAEEIREAASQEIIGMLMDEAKDHIDEEMEEMKEAAEKKEEKEEEQEEKLEKIKEKKEEQEELTEDILEVTQQLTEMSSTQLDIQDELKEMMQKMKLLEEDIKGAAVDNKI